MLFLIFEGNAFYHDKTLNLYPELYPKQVNLFWCGKQAVTKICEIGFNAGHSAMLLILGCCAPSLDFTIFDVNHHHYTEYCFRYIASEFQHVNFNFIRGDSIVTMPAWIGNNRQYMETYDVVHVDGGHTDDCVTSDFKHADMLLKVNGVLIVDDTDGEFINKHADLYISTGAYKELNLLKTSAYPHRILQKCKSTQKDKTYIYF